MKPILLRCVMCEAEMVAPVKEYETSKGKAIDFPAIKCVNGHGPVEMEIVGGLLGDRTVTNTGAPCDDAGDSA